MRQKYKWHSSFTLEFNRMGFLMHQLRSSQVLPLPPEETFVFFEDPRNLSAITPDWLDFRMRNPDLHEVYEGAEFDYTIRWLGFRFAWRSRIVEYEPPDRFTDIQRIGPYRSWEHLHTFERVPEGTLMQDTVTYSFSLPAVTLHRFLIRKQLENIFSFRSVKITEWAEAN